MYNHPDARYQKSERKIKTAISSLLWRRTVTLRVKDICHSAHLNPPTFYRHYRNPNQALTSLENNLVHEFRALLNSTPRDKLVPRKTLSLIFLFVYQNRSYFKTTNHRHNYYVLDQIITHTHQTIANHRYIPKLSLATYYGATIYLIAEWCNTTDFDLSKSPHYINHILNLEKLLNL
ncbi:hypothetical protein IJI91_03775 [Candidatus Saccharibacteria bacterium]|nr:hypothetical protein [Candidatus Saccharibacteria bacterium]